MRPEAVDRTPVLGFQVGPDGRRDGLQGVFPEGLQVLTIHDAMLPGLFLVTVGLGGTQALQVVRRGTAMVVPEIGLVGLLFGPGPGKAIPELQEGGFGFQVIGMGLRDHGSLSPAVSLHSNPFRKARKASEAQPRHSRTTAVGVSFDWTDF